MLFYFIVCAICYVVILLKKEDIVFKYTTMIIEGSNIREKIRLCLYYIVSALIAPFIIVTQILKEYEYEIKKYYLEKQTKDRKHDL